MATEEGLELRGEPSVSIRSTRPQTTPYLFACLAGAALGIWAVTHENSFRAWLVLVASAFLGFRAAMKLLLQPLVLVVDDRGFIDPALGDKRIPWDAIASVETRSPYKSLALFITLKEPRLWLSRRSPMQRVFAKLNSLLGYPEYFINLAGTNANVEAVARLFKEKSGCQDATHQEVE